MNPNPTTINNQIDLAALDAVLGSFIAAGKSDASSREKLYENFLPRLVAGTGSIAAVVLFARSTSSANSQSHSPVVMVSQFGWNQLISPTVEQVKETIRLSLQTESIDRRLPKSPQSVSTFLGKTSTIDGGEYLFVLVRKRDADQLVERLLEDLVKEIGKEVENFEFRRSASNQPLLVQELTHLVQLTQNVARTTNLRQLSIHLVNDLAKTTGADRVSFFNPNGKLLAVSGVSSAARTDLTRTLSRMAQLAAKSQQVVESNVDQIIFDDPALARRLTPLLKKLDSQNFSFVPIECDHRCCGVVSFEYFRTDEHRRDWIDQQKLISRSVEFIAPIVDRATKIYAIPGIGLLDWFFNRALARPIRLLITSALLTALLAAVGYVLFWIERPFEIQAEGRLQPRTTRHLYAPDDGEVRSLLVSDAQQVDNGQLLLTIESQSLNDQQIAIEGELAEIDKKLRNLLIADMQSGLSNNNDLSNQGADQQAQVAAEIEQLKLRQVTLEKRLSLLSTRLETLKVLAPIKGQVTTPDVAQRLKNRPINRGDWLLSISNLEDEWEIELNVPDQRIEFIQAADSPQVKFKIVASSEQVFTGQLRAIDFMVQPTDEPSSRRVSVWIDLNEKELGQHLRFGSRVLAKIDCGHRSNWFLLTYELRQKIREWWFW